MSKTEIPDYLKQTLVSVNRTPREVATSKIKAVAKIVLPENLKNRIRDRINKIPHLPLNDPQSVCVDRVKALLYINTTSDYYRLMRKDYEGPFTHEIIETLKRHKDGVFMDIGSAQGLYSILAAKIVKKAIAIDPNPYGIAELRKNARINGPEIENKLIILEIAAGNESGIIDLQVSPSESYAAFTRNYKSQSETTQACVKPIDELLDSGKIDIPTAVKIDVEGAEGMVIEGMKALLSSDRKPEDLFIEFHPTFLRKLGYNFQDTGIKVIESGYKPIASWKRTNEFLVHFSKCQ